MSRYLRLTVAQAQAGIRVDTLLHTHMGLSATVIRRVKWWPDGILVDGVRVNTRYLPSAGQELTVRLDDPERRSGILPVDGPLDIVFEDEDLLVLNKAPGVSVHPGPGHFDDTLGNFLLHYFDRSGAEGDFHPVHRLDRGTSGLLVVAKHPHAQERMKGQLHTGQFRRIYLAICQGLPQPPAGMVEAPLGRVVGSLVQRQVRPDGQFARTQFCTLMSAGDRTLLQLELDTGRTHQIRVHMAHIGHPLIGDFLYGHEDPALISRPALHSAQLHLTHPITGQLLFFSLPLPRDMQALLPDGVDIL